MVLWDCGRAGDMTQANQDMIEQVGLQKNVFGKNRRGRAKELLATVSKAMARRIPQDAAASMGVYRIIAPSKVAECGIFV